MHALYPISGYPPTWGHADVLARAARIFGRITWAAAVNPAKQYQVSLETRRAMLNDYVVHLGLDNVTVTTYEGSTARYAESIGAGVILKGLRNYQDLQSEMEQAFGNRSIAGNIETVTLFTDPRHAMISSSLVRELALLGEDLEGYVLPRVAERLREAIAQSRGT